MNLEQIVIENIKRIRKEKRISQEQLAELCNTSASYIGLMETYKNIPKLSTIERIAEALNVPVLTFFLDNGNKSASAKKSEEQKQKIREHIKKELLEKMSQNLDDALKLI